MLERSENNLGQILEHPDLSVFLGEVRSSLLRNPPEHFDEPDRCVSSDHQKRSILQFARSPIECFLVLVLLIF